MGEALNLYQKLSKIRSMSDAVQKSKRGYNYSYADITDILANITTGMGKYGVSLIPMIMPETATVNQSVTKKTKFTKTGEQYEDVNYEMVFSAEMVFRWVNDDNPDEHIDVPWYVTGSQSDPSQALGSGLTYCTRYFLCNYFQIAQTDTDVDAYRSKQKEAEVSESRAITEGIISQFDSLLRNYLAENPKMSDEVKKMISKYAKGGNYLAIKEPGLASKLLKEFKNTYLNVKKEEDQ